MLLFVRGNSHTRGNIRNFSVKGLQSCSPCGAAGHPVQGSSSMWSLGAGSMNSLWSCVQETAPPHTRTHTEHTPWPHAATHTHYQQHVHAAVGCVHVRLHRASCTALYTYGLHRASCTALHTQASLRQRPWRGP